MNLQDATTKTSTTKEEENSEYYFAGPYSSAPGATKNLPKSESGRQLGSVNSPTGCSEAPASSTDGKQSNSISSQHHGISPASASQPSEQSAKLSADNTMLIPPAMELDSSQLKLLLTADRLPPVTKQTLSELDLDRIMRNINLRVDVNFDHGLHFMPVDGGKARDKRRCAASYYEALGIEMSIYAFNAAHDATNNKMDTAHSSPVHQAFEPRLPDMLKTLQEVLGTLVPERDHFCVMENLDVAFLMQQIRKGVLDLVGLSQWLGALLKTHCAPMRDPLVDRMVTEIREGCAAQETQQVAQGLKTMFGVLEAMKLDVANHQIRAFRIVLVEDTVRFLQNHFLGRLSTNTINAERARRWYLGLPRQSPFLQAPPNQPDPFEPVGTLFRGMLLLLVRYERPKFFPDTFEFDAGRLFRLRIDIQDNICLEICYHIFRELAVKRNQLVPVQDEEYLSLRSGIRSVLDGPITGAVECSRWQKNISGVALEIARALSTRATKDAENGGNDSRCRVVNLDGNIIQLIEKTLESSFKSESPRYRQVQEQMHRRLETETFHLAKRYLSMSPLEMCEAQLQRNGNGNGNGNGHPADVEGVSKRIAHIGVLHWKVWAPLLYVRETPQTLEPGNPPVRDNGDSKTSTET